MRYYENLLIMLFKSRVVTLFFDNAKLVSLAAFKNSSNATFVVEKTEINTNIVKILFIFTIIELQ